MALSVDGDTAACCWADAVVANAATVAAVIRALLRIMVVLWLAVRWEWWLLSVSSDELWCNLKARWGRRTSASCLFVAWCCLCR